jgi:hypothetical protein
VLAGAGRISCWVRWLVPAGSWVVAPLPLAGSDPGGLSWVVAGMSRSSRRRDGGDAAVGLAGQAPAALMDGPVMGPAHQGQIREVGGGRHPAS